jgi:hypothetical protein
MEYLHSLSPSIIHRDLKSLNILKATNGSLKICDFGLVFAITLILIIIKLLLLITLYFNNNYCDYYLLL